MKEYVKNGQMMTKGIRIYYGDMVLEFTMVIWY